MPVITNTTGNKVVTILIALYALATNWDDTEVRQGRRGDFNTTGAGLIRVRELDENERGLVLSAAQTLGIDVDEDDVEEVFNGDHEYQATLACNRFTSKTGPRRGLRLTQNEERTIERLKAIMDRKPEAVREALGVPKAA